MRENYEEKIKQLISEMTLEEKAAQMIQVPYNEVTKEQALEWARKGAGSFLHVLGEDARALQQEALHTRMGIPMLFGIDAIHGHGLNEEATIFPSQLAASCSWNTELVRSMGEVTAREVATDGLHWTFSPVLCLGRDLRWGRINETFGEDPYLSGELGSAIIRGYQGDDLAAPDSILACAKHYIAYGEAVGARDACDSEITYRKLREVFLPPFKKAVEAGCATMMTAYGSLDGSPLTASKKALREILKDELGFDGFVVTDWNNVCSLVTNQHVAKDMAEASKMAAEAGNDMIMTTLSFYEEVIRLVQEGKLDEAVLDEAVSNILRIKFRMGLFKHPEKSGKPGCFHCEEHLKSTLALARESLVMLKNEGILPLKKDVRRIAVVGPNADDIRAQYGDWTYFTHPSPGVEKDPHRPYVTVLEGIREQAAQQGIEVTYSHGCDVISTATDEIPEAVTAANSADAVVLVIGDRIALAGEYRDRADLSLSGAQQELFDALAATGKPIITVFVSTKPLCIGRVAQQSAALLVSFNGGMFAGTAAAEAIFGKLNPSGRLSISFPYHTGQLPIYYNSLPGWHGGKYVDQPDHPLFAFGEGISYTEFAYGTPVFEEDSLKLSVEVTNTGTCDGMETVQVYVRDCVSSVLTPVRQLIAFEKTAIAAGETKQVSFQLKREDFSLINVNEERVTEPGEFILYVGHSSKEEDLKEVHFCLS